MPNRITRKLQAQKISLFIEHLELAIEHANAALELNDDLDVSERNTELRFAKNLMKQGLSSLGKVGSLPKHGVNKSCRSIA